MTPERLTALEALCAEYQSLNTVERWHDIVAQRSAALPEALAEIARLTERNERLELAAESFQQSSALSLADAEKAEAAVARLTERWEALGAWLDRARANTAPENYLYGFAVDDVKVEMSRLEREPSVTQTGGGQ